MSSAALGPGCAVAHPIRRAGRYVVCVWRDDVRVANALVKVGDDSRSKQVNLDLFELHRTARGLAPNAPAMTAELRSGAHLLLHVSHGEGRYHVTLHERDDSAIWDSRTLHRDDIYSALVLRPG